MKTLINFLICFFLSSNLYLLSQSGWNKQPINTLQNLNKIHFINANTGWIIGDSAIIYKTTNEGTSWAKNTYIGGGQLTSIYFKDTNFGIIGGYDGGHTNGLIIRTTNGGNQWFQSSYPGEPYDIFSFGGDVAWSSRHDGHVMKTTNMGISWAEIFVRQSLELYTIFFIDNNTGWTGGAVYQGLAYIYKTTNGGINWFTQFTHSQDHFRSIHFINSMTGFTSTLNGNIYSSTNGGTEWFIVASNTTNILFKVDFPSSNAGFSVGGSRVILKTNNGGVNWIEQLLPQGISAITAFHDTYFLTPNTGWVVGSKGTLLKTTNGGEIIGIQNIENYVPTNFNLSQNYPNPFNPTTKIEFDLPEASDVKLTIFDVMGKEIESIFKGYLQRGRYIITYDAAMLSSGVYFYTLQTPKFAETKKFVLLK